VFKKSHLNLPPHSVIEITWPDGRVTIFDGTIEQFGHKLDECWRLDKQEYQTRLLFPGTQWVVAAQKDIDKVKEGIMKDKEKYGKNVLERSENFLRNFDYNSIIGKTDEETREIATPLIENLLAQFLE